MMSVDIATRAIMNAIVVTNSACGMVRVGVRNTFQVIYAVMRGSLQMTFQPDGSQFVEMSS